MKKVGSLCRTSNDVKSNVINLYMQGFSQVYLEKTLHMTRKTIRLILAEAGIKSRDKIEQSLNHHIHSTLREDAFDVVSDDMAYWLGFIYADGYITNPEHTTAIGILLKLEDIGHIEKFKEFMKSPQKIYINDKGASGHNAKIKIGSIRLHNALRRWGITHNKSYDATPPEFMKYNRHFWRGVIDGDGHIAINKAGKKIVHLCGTEAMCNGFRNFLIMSGVDTDANVLKSKEKELWTFYVSESLAVGTAEILYGNSNCYLQRKYEKYLEFKK